MEICQRLFEVRKELKKSQLQMAEELGISGTAYKTYEKGTKSLPLQIVIDLHEKYNISVSWLILGGGQMKDLPPVGLVRNAYLAAKTFQEECNLSMDLEEEANLIQKMFARLYQEANKKEDVVNIEERKTV